MTTVPVPVVLRRGRYQHQARAYETGSPLPSAPGSPRPACSGATVAAMPTSGALVDPYGRAHTDLRVSVTDRCNLRCVYCMPEEGVPFRPRDEILSFEEITRVARVARSLGVSSLRLTGGEPLMRRGLVELVGQLATVGFDDIALTTNGTALAANAAALARAGLHRVNVSCDSLQPQRFAQIRRRGELAIVLAAMDAAESAGLVPLKVNVVVIAGLNDDEVVDFASFAREHGRVVRFIEYMPLGAAGDWDRGQVVDSAEIVARINDRWPLEAVEPPGTDPAPAVRYRFRDGGGEIGVVASVTRPFCGTCNRLRLTADGAVRNCLFSDDEVPVREILRNQGSDEDLALALRRSAWGKLPGHGINEPGFLQPARSMSMIGG
ncbi:MAG TPA: GTP 3',8-cyclase MoaA [Acidimicrobiales bacterium]|nr:GTP 3',8-cyclase MoaA [Acidimicrobiales bacterium]